MTQNIKGYKGFDKNLQCRGKQYEVGKTYEEDKAVLCETGMHFCENPLDCFSYRPPGISRYCEVEAEEPSDTNGEDTKRVTKKLTVVRERSLPELIKAAGEFIEETAKSTGDWSITTNIRYSSAVTSAGDYSAAANTGNSSVAINAGYQSTAASTGGWSAAINAGRYSNAANTGDYGVALSTGYQSAATSVGNCGTATSTGGQSTAVSTGDYSAAEVMGDKSIAFASGFGGKAAGALGCWIVLAEWDYNGDILDVKAAKVDGETSKANVFYTFVDGEFREAGECGS
jgi:hypothetical protein